MEEKYLIGSIKLNETLEVTEELPDILRQLS